MVTHSQREKFQTLMRGTIISLCQNVLDHKSEIKVEMFIGITLDKKQDFHFSVVETLRADAVSESTTTAKPVEVTPQPAAPQPRSGSMLERLMANDISPTQQSQSSLAPIPKAREVSSTTASDQRQNLSYSELLRSFGELSRQDNTPMSSNSSAACPTLYNTLSTNSVVSRGADPINPVNQAQVVIPINFAIHSPSSHGNHAAGNHGNRSQENFEHSNSPWNDTPSSSRRKVSRYERDVPDSTYTMPEPRTHKSDTEYNSYNVKVKQEVLSEDETESTVDRYHHPLSRSSPQSSSSLLTELRRKVSTAKETNASTENSTLSRGILMSLLCEKSPGARGKKRGRPKKKADDPLYVPSKVGKPATSQGKRDNRVLIGLTDYLPGFKEGDLNQEKPPRCVFYSEDISAKTCKVILLNSGPFATVRMVHRSLQGMRANEIGDIMRGMTRPRQHPEYVGEYKSITMPKLWQGRKMVGVFYKCPLELMNSEALKHYDIELDDYVKFFSQVFRYDRTPQPQYFQSIEMFSPFYGTFGGDHGWREDPTGDPTLTLDTIHQASSLFDQPPGDKTDKSKSDQTHDNDNTSLCISGIKSEQPDWDSIPEETDNDGDSIGTPVTSTQREWSLGDEGSPSGDDMAPDTEALMTARDQVGSEVSTPSPQHNNHHSVTYMPPDFGKQVVFPQPLIVADPDRRRKHKSGTNSTRKDTDKQEENSRSVFTHDKGQPVFPEPSQPVFPQAASQPVYSPNENQPIFPQPISTLKNETI